jgi:uncharacterized protein YciI
MYDPGMKRSTLTVLAVLVFVFSWAGAAGLAAQTSTSTPAPKAEATPLKSWFIRIIHPRPTFDKDMSAAEQDLMVQHFNYWKALNEKGVCLFGGPVFDKRGVYAVIVVRAATEDEARTLGEADPSVKAGLDKIEVAEMEIAFLPKGKD